MDIFIGNLPGDAPLIALYNLLGDIDLRADFEHRWKRDIHDRSYHYLIAYTDSRAAGVRLIAGINGRAFHGRALVAREYTRRKKRHEG